MGLRTPLYDSHVRLGAKIVDFGGWDMPLHYGSQIDEHHAVRRACGMFDVSHMGIVDLRGAGAAALLARLLANDVGRLQHPGKGLYSCMLRDDGGVLDDLIVYRMDAAWFRVIVNAGTRARDLDWIRAQAGGQPVEILERTDLAMIAVQGPEARRRLAGLFGDGAGGRLMALPPFVAAELGAVTCGGTALAECFVARTGYTGEDGFEVALPATSAEAAWDALRGAGVRCAGLGARDTLRLEAGYSLYGHELDEAHDPIGSGVAWTVAFEPASRQFIGRAALEAVCSRPAWQVSGLLLLDRGVLRSEQRVSTDRGEGVTTSGSFSPTLGRSIALARLPYGAAGRVRVDVRGRELAARIVPPAFVRHGKILIDKEILGEQP